MFPREVIIGGIVVSIQLLYSVVYPYAEQTLKFIPQQVDEFWRDVRGAPASFNGFVSTLLHNDDGKSSAAKLTPGKQAQGGEQGQKMRQNSQDKGLSRREVVEQALSGRLLPHMSTITQTFRDNGKIDIESEGDIEISWDVHRITDAEVPWAYFFRVGVKNKSPRPCLFQGVARFYVLRAPDGLVFPIHRITEGPAAFTLNTGQDYRYAWVFYTKYKTLEASGGLLLENRTHPEGELQNRFFNTTLSPIQPAKAKGVAFKKVEEMLASHNFMGVLDLRDVTYI